MRDLAENGEGMAKVRSRNLLAFFYGEEYPLSFEFDSTGVQEYQASSELENEQEEIEKVDKVVIQIFPNPASTTLNVRYISPSIYGNTGQLTLYTSFGQALHSVKIANQFEAFTLDVSNWPSGMYYCVYEPTRSTKKVIPFIITH